MEQVHHRLFCRVRVAQSSGFYVVFSEALFFSFMLGIVVLDLLQFTASDYPCILPLSLINANQRLIRTCAVHLVINCVFII